MTALLRTLLSLALSGSVLILLLLLLLPRLRSRTRRRWQYYIWLAAVWCMGLPMQILREISQYADGEFWMDRIPKDGRGRTRTFR